MPSIISSIFDAIEADIEVNDPEISVASCKELETKVGLFATLLYST